MYSFWQAELSVQSFEVVGWVDDQNQCHRLV